jgi:hypothetical protein
MICWRCHSNSVNTRSRLPISSDVKTRKRRNVVGIDIIRNNRIPDIFHNSIRLYWWQKNRISLTVLALVFVHPVISCIRILHVKCKIFGKVKMETTAMWGITLIILKDIKCFQIWAYFEGIGINFNFENFQNKIVPLFILRTIRSMHARYHRTLQHLSKIEGWFVFTEMLKIVTESG